jgi:glycosyltransferase involved in cell wall biosynthesis
LASIFRQDYASKEVIVVDDVPEDDSDEIIQSYPDIK